MGLDRGVQILKLVHQVINLRYFIAVGRRCQVFAVLVQCRYFVLFAQLFDLFGELTDLGHRFRLSQGLKQRNYFVPKGLYQSFR